MTAYGIVYKVTNQINGRQYVGYTTATLKRRKAVHFSDARCDSEYLFHKAIRKYGEENFIFVEIASSWDDENLRGLEKLMISQERTMSIQGGYNLTGGGEGHSYFDPEIQARITEKNRNHPKVRRITHDGVTKTITQWEDHLGFKRGALRDRLYYGWSEEQAITSPITAHESPIGERKARLVITEVLGRKNNNTVVKARCDCGNEHTMLLCNFRSKRGRTQSCGCLNKELLKARNAARRLVAKIDEVFHRLTVIGETVTIDKVRMVPVECSCEQKTKKHVPISPLINGHIKSCGCLNREMTIARNKASGRSVATTTQSTA